MPRNFVHNCAHDSRPMLKNFIYYQLASVPKKRFHTINVPRSTETKKDIRNPRIVQRNVSLIHFKCDKMMLNEAAQRLLHLALR